LKTAPRRQQSRRLWRAGWLLPGLLAGLLSCNSGDSEPALDMKAQTPTGRVRIFLIAPNDAGASGRAAGCGDSAVPVAVNLPRTMPALEGALQALLDLQNGGQAAPDATLGYYNALYASPLKVDRIDRNGGEVRVHLAGYLEVADGCDGSRALAQLTETALQFSDVQRAQFLLDGQPLRDLLPKKR
jgi:hypothetical protein